MKSIGPIIVLDNLGSWHFLPPVFTLASPWFSLAYLSLTMYKSRLESTSWFVLSASLYRFTRLFRQNPWYRLLHLLVGNQTVPSCSSDFAFGKIHPWMDIQVETSNFNFNQGCLNTCELSPHTTDFVLFHNSANTPLTHILAKDNSCVTPFNGRS